MIAAVQPERVFSEREVARRLGVSHTMLQKARRAGRIAPEPDGGWDVEKVRTQLVQSSDPARKTAALAPSLPTAPKVAVPPPPVATLPQPADPLPRAAQINFHDARTANEILKAQERRLRLDERKGKLVDKARALLLVHRLAKEERDAILAWPARVSAEMAAELGVDAHRLQTMMDTRLRAHLAARHDVRVSVG